MAEDLTAIQEKLDKGEALTPEENAQVMGAPPDWEDKEDKDDDPIDDSEYKDVDDEKDKTRSDDDDKSDKKVNTKKKEEGEPKKDEEPEPTESEMREELREELEKPRSERKDYNKYTTREKAYFHELKLERKARQTAEKELEIKRLSDARVKAAEEIKPTENADDKDGDEFVSRAEVEDMVRKQSKAGQDAPAITIAEKRTQAYLKVCEREANKDYDDYVEVMECYNEIIANDPVYLEKVAVAMDKGENALTEAYHLIKDDPEFDTVVVKARARIKRRDPSKTTPKKSEDTSKEDAEKEKQRLSAEEKEKKVKENQSKTKTSGNFSGGASGEDADSVTAVELHDMTDAQFYAMPKAKRDKLLKKFGA